MNSISGDQLLLFDNQQKLPISECSETSLVTIGSDLLSQEFLKVTVDNGISRNDSELGNTANYTDQLLIINNDLSAQQQITLDDVDLDLSHLSQSLDNNVIVPQESLGFNDFLSQSNFCLTNLSEKLTSNPEKPQFSFSKFGNVSDQNGSAIIKESSKEFKNKSHFSKTQPINTIHIPEVHQAGGSNSLANGSLSSTMFQRITPPGLSIQTLNSTQNGISAAMATLPTIDPINTGLPLKLNSGGEIESVAVVVQDESEPEIDDLLKVRPKIAKSKTTNTKTKRKAKNAEGVTGKKKKNAKKKQAATANISIETFPKNAMPRFNIIQERDKHSPDKIVTSETIKLQSPATSTATIVIPTTIQSSEHELNSSAGTVSMTLQPTVQEPVELILPVVSVRSEEGTKPLLKPISELQPEDVCTVRRDPLKKLSKIQLQQIVQYLRQRKPVQNSSVPDKRSANSKIICRIMYPDEFLNGENKLIKSNGKPNKIDDEPPKPKKIKFRLKESESEDEFVSEKTLTPLVTRSGRTSRPPKMLTKLNDSSTKSELKTDKNTSSLQSGSVLASENGEKKLEEPKSVLFDGLPEVKKKSNAPVRSYFCPTCGKSYVIKASLLKHLLKFPHHADKEFTSEIQSEVAKENPSKVDIVAPKKKSKCRCKCKTHQDCRALKFSLKQMIDLADEKDLVKVCAPRFAKTTSVWDFMLLKVKAIYKFEDYVKGLLSEMGKLLDILKSVSSKILYPSNQTSETSVEVRDDLMSQVMGVNKGFYQTFPSGLEISKDETPQELFFAKDDVPNLQKELALVHPDTKEDISQSSLLSDIMCDKSVMDTMDALVSERLKTLAPGDDLMVDPPSDYLMNSLLSAVQCQSLSESTFNTSVSGSTEDLLKALENLSSDIPPNSAPTLDWSSEFNSSER